MRLAERDHAKLIRVYGAKPGTCKGCVHLHAESHDRTWYKCDQAYQSSSAATDWRVSWPACGKYEEVK